MTLFFPCLDPAYENAATQLRSLCGRNGSSLDYHNKEGQGVSSFLAGIACNPWRIKDAGASRQESLNAGTGVGSQTSLDCVSCRIAKATCAPATMDRLWGDFKPDSIKSCAPDSLGNDRVELNVRGQSHHGGHILSDIESGEISLNADHATAIPLSLEMSSPSDMTLDSIFSTYFWMSVIFHLSLAMSVVVVYDWVLSLPRELRLFWAGNARSLSAWLYFANRYIALFSEAGQLLVFVPWSAKLHTYSVGNWNPNCNIHARPSSQSWCLSIAVFALTCMPFAAALLATSVIPNVNLYRITILNRVCAIVADASLIILTWRSLHQHVSHVMTEKGLMGVFLRNAMSSPRVDLTPALLRALLILNILLLIVFQQPTPKLIPPQLHARVTGDPASPTLSPISSILVSHFMLDLQEAYQRSSDIQVWDDSLCTSQHVISSGLIFVPALGSIAAHIDAPHLDTPVAETDSSAYYRMSQSTMVFRDAKAEYITAYKAYETATRIMMELHEEVEPFPQYNDPLPSLPLEHVDELTRMPRNRLFVPLYYCCAQRAVPGPAAAEVLVDVLDFDLTQVRVGPTQSIEGSMAMRIEERGRRWRGDGAREFRAYHVQLSRQHALWYPDKLTHAVRHFTIGVVVRPRLHHRVLVHRVGIEGVREPSGGRSVVMWARLGVGQADGSAEPMREKEDVQQASLTMKAWRPP
ncbi:hypothetical protein BD309DRAFT_983780 [Dichomitus squalens]|nr:hypothetical protein BD309DRAFT_983780 [Dichomitus squalens]